VNDQDKDLHDEKISALYRQLPDVQPSAETDALIRASARRAVGAGPQRKGFSFDLKQLTATAAVLMLSVGLVVQWQKNEPEKLQEALSSAPAAMPESLAIPDADVAPAAKPPAEIFSHRTTQRSSAADKPIENLTREATAAVRQKKQENAYSAPAASSTGGMAVPAPAPAVVAEDRAETDAGNWSSGVLSHEPASAARETSLAGEAEKSLRRDDALAASAAAQRSKTASRAKELKAEAATKSALPIAKNTDYRSSMAKGDYPQALSALNDLVQTDKNATLLVDRDMMGLLLGRQETAECQKLSAKELGEEKPLCDFLVLQAQGLKPAANPEKLSGVLPLISGESAYRHPAAKMLFKLKP